MRPIQHSSNNDMLLPPAGTADIACKALAITRMAYQKSNGQQIPAVVSYWQPTPEDLHLLNAGRPVYLSVLGFTLPPLAIGVEGDGNL